MAMRVQNVQQGYVDATGFHPIRGSADYDPSRAGEVKKKAKKAKGRKAAKKRPARKVSARKAVGARSGGLRTQVRRSNPHAEQYELETYITSDSQLYRSQHQPIQKNLINKMAAGKYQHNLAVKLFGYLVEAGAKKYAKEFGGTWNQIFSVADRKAVAESLTESFEDEAKLGNYDNYLAKKYQGKTQQNPIPMGRFVNAKVRMLKGGLTQVLLEGKAVGKRLVGKAKRAVNPSYPLPKLSDWDTIYDSQSSGQRSIYKHQIKGTANSYIEIAPSYSEVGRFKGYKVWTWAWPLGTSHHADNKVFSTKHQAYTRAKELYNQ